MKLVIMVPAFNEENVLADTLSRLPGTVSGFDEVEILVLDDGSEDETGHIARESGATLVTMETHSGLARTFARGLEEGLARKADCIVNFDADGQYKAEDIARLVQPVLEGKADMVLGDRQVGKNPHFSFMKKVFQKVGSWTVRLASGISVHDAATGFRAYSARAARRLMVFSSYTYTLETIIQAGIHDIRTVSIPVETHPPSRPSRLYSSVPAYILRAGMTILRIFTLYRPLRVFTIAAVLFLTGGMALFVRFLYYFLVGQGHGHVQSVILGAVLIIVGIQVGLIGLLADLISINRRLLEDLRWKYMEREQRGG